MRAVATYVKTDKQQMMNSSTKMKNNYLLNKIRKNYEMYLIMIPGLIFLFLFKYTPMYGVIIAFQDFNIFDGISGSKWVGMANFTKLFHSEEFYQVFRNTLVISIYKTVLLFPIPIMVAVILNEVKKIFFKRTVQTIIYLPHFLSWVIIGGLFVNILSTSGGMVNNVIRAFGGEPISFMLSNAWFRSVLVFSAGWKETGLDAPSNRADLISSCIKNMPQS